MYVKQQKHLKRHKQLLLKFPNDKFDVHPN